MQLYLNNTGHRWVNRPNEAIRIKTQWGIIERMPKYWEAIGNFAVATVSISGKLVRVPTPGYDFAEREE